MKKKRCSSCEETKWKLKKELKTQELFRPPKLKITARLFLL